MKIREKVLLGKACIDKELEDLIHDEKNSGRLYKLKDHFSKYGKKYCLWAKIDKVLEEAIRKVENIYDKHNC